MRRIDKSKILSTKYKKWLDKQNRDKKKHPEKSVYRKDVVMNLLHCQKGLCAYTETLLCEDETLLSEENWQDGRYNVDNPSFEGDLEHFDPNLKEKQNWEWDNLFVSRHKPNVLKSDQGVDYILKPDSPDYDPMKLLTYVKKYHVFRPHSGLKDENVIARIKEMIEVLQLNYGTYREKRKKYFKQMFTNREYGTPFKHEQFLTACRMIENEMMEEE